MKYKITQTGYDWRIRDIEEVEMEKLKAYLKQESNSSIGSRPERIKGRTSKMFLVVTKDNISKEKLQGWLDSYQP